MNRGLFLFLLFWVAICVLCVYSIAYAEIVKEVRVEVKVEKVIKKENIVYTDWTNPDNIQGVPNNFYFSQEGFLCKSEIVTFWQNGVQQAGRSCRLPNGSWRVLN